MAQLTDTGIRRFVVAIKWRIRIRLFTEIVKTMADSFFQTVNDYVMRSVRVSNLSYNNNNIQNLYSALYNL